MHTHRLITIGLKANKDQEDSFTETLILVKTRLNPMDLTALIAHAVRREERLMQQCGYEYDDSVPNLGLPLVDCIQKQKTDSGA